jgi:mRNA interferase MazF
LAMANIRRGDVWWISFDPSIGGEIQKTRPAVIVSNNAANAVLNRVVVVPITSQTAKLYPGEARITVDGKAGKAMADQIATASKQRLRSRLGSLTTADMRSVEGAILAHLAIYPAAGTTLRP